MSAGVKEHYQNAVHFLVRGFLEVHVSLFIEAHKIPPSPFLCTGFTSGLAF